MQSEQFVLPSAQLINLNVLIEMNRDFVFQLWVVVRSDSQVEFSSDQAKVLMLKYHFSFPVFLKSFRLV